MIQEKHNISVFRGDSYPIAFILKDSSTRLPINLEGYSFTMTVNRYENPQDNTSRLFSIQGTAGDDPSLGRITFNPTSSNNSEVGHYFYDVQITTESGYVMTIVKSGYDIIQDISK